MSSLENCLISTYLLWFSTRVQMEKNWGDTPSATLKAAKRMKDQKKSKVQTQWLSWIDQSASNSYLTGNNICNVALRHTKNILKEKLWSDHKKIKFSLSKPDQPVNERKSCNRAIVQLVKSICE